MGTALIKNTDRASFTVQYYDGAVPPQPVAPKGGATWTVSDDTVLTIVSQSTDGTSAVIDTVGPVGTCQVACKENDPGADNLAVTGVLEIQVIASEAMSAVITLGPTEPKPVVPPAGRRR
jgi:hypothetical protein